MKPGKESGEIVIETVSEQQAAIWALDYDNSGLYSDIVRRLSEEAPINLSLISSLIVLVGLRNAAILLRTHPYHVRVINMLDEYDLSLL